MQDRLRLRLRLLPRLEATRDTRDGDEDDEEEGEDLALGLGVGLGAGDMGTSGCSAGPGKLSWIARGNSRAACRPAAIDDARSELALATAFAEEPFRTTLSKRGSIEDSFRKKVSRAQ